MFLSASVVSFSAAIPGLRNYNQSTGQRSLSFCFQDGTIKLWDYECGRRLQSCDVTAPEDAPSADGQKVTVTSRPASDC